MRPLGPIGSYQTDGVDPTNMLYIGLDERLASTETISTVYVTTATTGITISDQEPTIDVVDDNGTEIAIGQAVQFRVTITVEMEADANIICSYVTSLSNADVVTVPLMVVKKVT